MKKVQFVGVDSGNRPIFKSVTDKVFYGSTDILFGHDAKETEVIERVNANQLEYFGSRFGCEPHGGLPSEPLEIVKSN